MKNIKCLIIDDDMKIRTSIKELISEFHPDWFVDDVGDGQEGINKLTKTNGYDIVLTDYEMKPKNGLDVLEHIFNEKLNVLSVMITSHANPTTFKGSIKFRVADFIEKPINATALLNILKNLEEEIKEKRKHIELEKIGQASAMILHDIRNPLTVIMGSLQLIQETTGEEQTLKFSKQIKRSSDKIIGIIENMTDKIGNTTCVNEDSSLSEVNHSLQEFVQYKKVPIKYEFDLPDIKVNLSLIDVYQIFTNLINNSLDAISDMPIESQFVKISVKEETETDVVISFVDSGRGISPENISKIFDPLFSIKKKDKGTGLGLRIIKDLLNLKYGDIVYNPESFNTEFLITISKC